MVNNKENDDQKEGWVTVIDDEGPAMPIRDVVEALWDVPILARLQFAKSLILAHGGDDSNAEFVPGLLASVEVLEGVIEVLLTHPRAAKLVTPAYKPGP